MPPVLIVISGSMAIHEARSVPASKRRKTKGLADRETLQNCRSYNFVGHLVVKEQIRTDLPAVSGLIVAAEVKALDLVFFACT